MKTLLAILLLCSPIFTQVDKTQWTALTSVIVDESKSLYEIHWYRNDSIVRKPPVIKFWSREQKWSDKWQPEYSLSLIEFNCDEQTMNIRQSLDYDGKGELTRTLNNVTDGFENVPPDTLASTMLTKMCALK